MLRNHFNTIFLFNNSYTAGAAAVQLWWHLSNMNGIWRIWYIFVWNFTNIQGGFKHTYFVILYIMCHCNLDFTSIALHTLLAVVLRYITLTRRLPGLMGPSPVTGDCYCWDTQINDDCLLPVFRLLLELPQYLYGFHLWSSVIQTKSWTYEKGLEVRLSDNTHICSRSVDMCKINHLQTISVISGCCPTISLWNRRVAIYFSDFPNISWPVISDMSGWIRNGLVLLINTACQRCSVKLHFEHSLRRASVISVLKLVVRFHLCHTQNMLSMDF